jgi:hypothetical protein
LRNNSLSKNIIAKPECVLIIAYGTKFTLLCLLPFDCPTWSRKRKMKRIKFLLFVAVLIGFAALAHAGFDEGKAAILH